MTAHTEALATTSNERERDADAAHARTTTMIARGTRPTTTRRDDATRRCASIIFRTGFARARVAATRVGAQRRGDARARGVARARNPEDADRGVEDGARAGVSGGVRAVVGTMWGVCASRRARAWARWTSGDAQMGDDDGWMDGWV